MSFSLDIADHIPDQIISICDYYDEKRIGLGKEAETEIYAILDRIEKTPRQFPITRNKIRRAIVNRFPLSVFFVLYEDKNCAFIVDILPQASGNTSRQR
ncbi:MAG: hypothetical protein SF052_05340 [Bacteroidia bacterium]|nr:hypothetical protein [Bacteroidia bacterium]